MYCNVMRHKNVVVKTAVKQLQRQYAVTTTISVFITARLFSLCFPFVVLMFFGVFFILCVFFAKVDFSLIWVI